MNFQFYLEKLFASSHFQDFISENKDAYPCSCFFTIDLENKEKPDNKSHFDYFVPSTNRLFSFKLEEGCEKIPVEIMDNKIPEEIANNYDFDFEKIKELIENAKQKENVTHKTQKILLSLQHLDGKDYLVGTIFISALGIIKVHIDITEMKITLFEKRSLFDMMNVFKKKT